VQCTEPELERCATEQLAEENGPEAGSNPALWLNASQPPNQNCADGNNGELPPNDFKQQAKHAEGDDKPEQPHRDFRLRLSLRRTFSCGYPV